MKKNLLVLLIISFNFLGYAAKTTASPVEVFGVADCGEWFNPPARFHTRGWLLGYLTGKNDEWNNSGMKPSNPLAKLGSGEQAYLWMDNYCKQNPLSDVFDGARVLFRELIRKATPTR